MKNMFYYTEKRKNTEGVEVDVQDAFNIDKMVLTYAKPDGSSIVVLNDWREQYIDMPVQKGNKIVSEKRKVPVCSEINLNVEDSLRFRELFEAK